MINKKYIYRYIDIDIKLTSLSTAKQTTRFACLSRNIFCCLCDKRETRGLMDATAATDATGAVVGDKLEMFRQLNLLEQHRVESFKDWPFPEQSSCSISKMAEAGFYWTGTKRENDTATCFVCNKTLDGWESDDDPWKEHLKHAPQCEFVKLGCAEKDLTVTQFLEILGRVVKTSIEKNCKAFKQGFISDNENSLDKFTHNK